MGYELAHFSSTSDWLGAGVYLKEPCLDLHLSTFVEDLATETKKRSCAMLFSHYVFTMSDSGNSNVKQHACIVNVGLFRSGTTTLTKAAERLGLESYRQFPTLSEAQHNDFLHKPEKLVLDWVSNGGLTEIIRLAAEYDIICDGWIALLPLLPHAMLDSLKGEAGRLDIQLEFVASTRDVESTVKSELQHWTIYDLERNAGLDQEQRVQLEQSLRKRAMKHQRGVQHLESLGALKPLPLHDGNIAATWSKTLSLVSDLMEENWLNAIQYTGVQNSNPPLPVEGILLTIRLGTGNESNEKIASVESLLDQIEQDSLCRYLVVLAIDSDEEGSDGAVDLIDRLKARAEPKQQLQSFHLIINPPKRRSQPFAICSVWDDMAVVAWKNGADWVCLMGDDVDVQCPYHYRAIYRSFLDISKRLKVPLGFGNPWWNDKSFPGFPSFPCIGKAHYAIFGGLIPEHRRHCFVNQDLDPYLHHLYLKFMASPCVREAILFNRTGGNIGSSISSEARYKRIPAQGWQDFFLNDLEPIRKYLPVGTTEALLLDVIVPSYRVRLDYLHSICSLKVPEHFRTLFIIIVDNPKALLRSAAVIVQQSTYSSLTPCPSECMTLDQGERILEEYLSQSGGNHVRVRCNKTNLGASASRNRGLDESAAEFVLHLDDDLVPNSDLLEQYGCKLKGIDESVVGLVGLVRFPRSPTLPMRHAAILMSYLTFMFEIAENGSMLYDNPAWGVTANILFRRTTVRFDLAYAKTGGGEDVDYSLRVSKMTRGGKLLAVPEACVVHPFWPGSVWTLSSHFFNWAVGDGALFQRFPEYCYWSFPNIPEILFLMSPLSLWMGGPWKLLKLVAEFVAADFLVDFSNQAEYKHRCLQVDGDNKIMITDGSNSKSEDSVAKRSCSRSRLFYFSSHVLANLYVVVLEFGRLYGHMLRKDVCRGMICKRFDWHCGRLKNAPWNFRKREACKFALFMGILVYEFGAGEWLESHSINPWSIIVGKK